MPLCFQTNNAEFLAEFSPPFFEHKAQRHGGHRGVIATDYCKGTSISMPRNLRKQTNFKTLVVSQLGDELTPARNFWTFYRKLMSD